MKAFLSKLAILTLFCFFVPLIINAVTIQNPLKAQNFTELLNAIVGFIMWLAISVTPIIIIIAGYFFITSMGDPEKIKTAKKMIIWALVGLIIIFSAWTIIGVIREVFR